MANTYAYSKAETESKLQGAKSELNQSIQSLQNTTARYAFDTLQQAQDKWASFSQGEKDELDGKTFFVKDKNSEYKWNSNEDGGIEFIREDVNVNELKKEALKNGFLINEYNLSFRVEDGVHFYDGYLSYSDGSILNSDSAQYSSPINLKKEEIILVRCSGSNVTIISETNQAGTTFNPVVRQSTQNPVEVKNYTYRAEQDTYVIISGRKGEFEYIIANPNKKAPVTDFVIPAYTFKDFQSGYYNLSGTTPSSATSSLTVRCSFDVIAGQKILYQGGRSGTQARSYAIVDSNNQIIERADVIHGDIKEVRATAPYNIIVPEGGVKIYLNLDKEFTEGKVFYEGWANQISGLLNASNSAQPIETLLNQDDLEQSYYPLADEYVGTRAYSANTRSASVDVQEGGVYILSGKAVGANSRTYAIADETGKILEVHPQIYNIDKELIFITIPQTGVKLYLNNSIGSDGSGSLPLQNNFYVIGGDFLTLTGQDFLEKSRPRVGYHTLPFRSNWNESTLNNQSIVWISTLRKTEKMPINIGYYFNDYPISNGKIYYASSFNEAPVEIVDFDDNGGVFSSGSNMISRLVAVSPKHKSIITSVSDMSPGLGLRIYEDGQFGEVNKTEPMQAWLYNVGITFLEDSQGNEYCLYGEYSHDSKPTRRIFKGIYPYINPENWRVVHTMVSDGSAGSIHHIHHIQKDPWNDFIYATTGDDASESKILYSADEGETWSVLAENYPNQALRLTNMIFFEDKILWVTDSTDHFIMKAERDVNGLMSNIQSIHDLDTTQATNAVAYIPELDWLFLYDRTSSETLKTYIYDLDKDEVRQIGEIEKAPFTTGLWGNRGKCYSHYPNLSDKKLIAGFLNTSALSLNHDIPGNDGGVYGSIMYSID